jgi:hypothetical protein
MLPHSRNGVVREQRDLSVGCVDHKLDQGAGGGVVTHHRVAVLRGWKEHAPAVEHVITVGGGRQRLLRRARAVAIAHRQGVHRCRRRHAIHDEIGLGPLPAIEGVHGGADHEAARMRLLRQPGERQRW